MIRKVIATVIISLVTLNYIQAQDKFKRELFLGASFGTTFSKVSFAQTKVQQKIKMGYTGGLTLRWITEKNLGLQAELNFIRNMDGMKSSRTNLSINTAGQSTTLNFRS